MGVALQASDAEPNAKSPRAFAERVLNLIEAFGCQPIPRAYEVFFAYAMEKPVNVRSQVDEAAKPDGILRSFDLERIYHDNFRSAEGAWERQEQASVEIEQSLASVISVIDGQVTSGQTYEESLRKASSEFAKADAEGPLLQIVDGLISDTDAICKASQAMTSSLAQQRDAISEMQAEFESARKDALTDPLTVLGNRRAFENGIEGAMRDAVANGRQLAFGLIDIDRFHRVNDQFDNSVGDAVLRSLGQLIAKRSEGLGTAYRFGGEEFTLIMLGHNIGDVQQICEKLRSEIEQKNFVVRHTGAEIGKLTISAGVTTLQSGDSSDDLLSRATAMLEKAKSRGGNRVATDPAAMF